MKNIFIILAILCLQVKVFGQFDDKFYHPTKDWKNVQLPVSSEELFFYPDSDTLYAVLCKPEVTPLATIFYIHGNFGNITYNAPVIHTLVKAGFQVFVTDFRGYGKSSGTPTHTNIASDGQLVFDSLIKRPDIQDTQLILYGASIGSQLASKLAHDNSSRVDALVLEGAMNSFADIALLTIPENQRESIRPYLIFPYSANTDILATDRIPKLIIHSPEDRNIPFSQGKALFEAAPEPKTFLECKGGHIEALQLDTDKVIMAIRKLIHH